MLYYRELIILGVIAQQVLWCARSDIDPLIWRPNNYIQRSYPKLKEQRTVTGDYRFLFTSVGGIETRPGQTQSIAEQGKREE